MKRVTDYVPTSEEKETGTRTMERVRGRGGFDRVKVSKSKDGQIAIAPAHQDVATGTAQLVDAMGLSSFDLGEVLINQLANAISVGRDVSELALNGALAVIKGIQPRDDLEALLAAQMAVTHNLTMDLGRRLKNADTLAQQDSAVNALTKLGRTFATQLATLKNYRTGGEQRVTVTHVNISDGGRAIVGNVNYGPPKGEGSQ